MIIKHMYISPFKTYEIEICTYLADKFKNIYQGL